MSLRDLEPVYQLGERLFRPEDYPSLYRTWDEFELAAFFESDFDTCFVAEDDDGRVIGFTLGTVIEKRRSAWRYGWIVWLGVDPDVGRTGVASKLLEQLTEVFEELGCRILLADTDPDNDPAVRFFERHGFGNPRAHVYIEKNLTKKPEPRPRPRTRSGERARGRRPAAHPKTE